MASQLFIGSVGICPDDRSAPSIFLNAQSGTITGNFDINANVNFTEPGVNATFESLVLSDLDILPNSTADRLVVQLPNTNDVIKITYDGRVGRSSGVGAGDWVLGAPEANNGYSFRINTSQPNLQLYAPDSGGATALYNTASAGYEWYLGPGGDASLGPTTIKADCSVNGNINCTGTINAPQILINGAPIERDSAQVVFVNGNYTVTNDGIDREIYINAVPVGANPLVITVANDVSTQQQVNISIFNPGTATFIGVGTPSPSLSFQGGGQQTVSVNLLNAGPGGSSLSQHWVQFKYVNYGPVGDWWVWK